MVILLSSRSGLIEFVPDMILSGRLSREMWIFYFYGPFYWYPNRVLTDAFFFSKELFCVSILNIDRTAWGYCGFFDSYELLPIKFYLF